jgi:hypothetical protein
MKPTKENPLVRVEMTETEFYAVLKCVKANLDKKVVHYSRIRWYNFFRPQHGMIVHLEKLSDQYEANTF